MYQMYITYIYIYDEYNIYISIYLSINYYFIFHYTYFYYLSIYIYIYQMVDFPALGMLVCRFAWSFRYQSRNVVMWSGVPVRNDCCVSMPQSKIEDN